MGLEKHKEGIPDGAFWMTGKLWKSLIADLVRDRFKLAETSGTEDATDTGRVGIVNPGGSGGTVEIFIGVDGIVHKAKIVATITA